MIAIIGIHYRNYAHHTLYGSCLPIYGIAIIFYFLMISKETLTFLLLSNVVLQYTKSSGLIKPVKYSSLTSIKSVLHLQSCSVLHYDQCDCLCVSHAVWLPVCEPCCVMFQEKLRVATDNLLFLMEYAVLPDGDIILNNTTFRWNAKVSEIAKNWWARRRQLTIHPLHRRMQ